MRWIGGGTGAGKSTVARALADAHEARVYDGDRAEHGWAGRATAQEHPRFHAMIHAGPAGAWRSRLPGRAVRRVGLCQGRLATNYWDRAAQAASEDPSADRGSIDHIMISPLPQGAG